MTKPQCALLCPHLEVVKKDSGNHGIIWWACKWCGRDFIPKPHEGFAADAEPKAK